MEPSEIKSKLKVIFETIFQQPGIEITEDLTADKVARWDSLTHLTMIAEVEQQFGVKFKLKELVNMKNVGELIALLQAKTSN